MAIIHTLVEGPTDEAVANRIIEATGHTPGTCYGKKGCGYIKKKVEGFNKTAKLIYYLVLIDLMDTDENCSPEVVAKWLPNPEPRIFFRVVEREMESWLLADRLGIATFLKIDAVMVTVSPEQLPDPKLELIRLARRSNDKQIRESLIPDSGTTAMVGKLYRSEITRFINTIWNIQAARMNAPSLEKCLKRLEEI